MILKYYIKSLIGEVAGGIDSLIEKNIITQDRRIILYGLDRYSYAMRTILSNKGYNNIECYISNDEAAVADLKRDIKNFACRYLNGTSDIIGAELVSDRLVPFDDNALILIASKSYEEEKAVLERLGYREGVHSYKVCDFVDGELDGIFKGKRRMTLKEMQDTEKEILRYVDVLCRENGLRYWVCGGTLLGTIRHKGFIPWDDDIDIFLPWKDYIRFIEVFKENGNYAMLGLGTSDVKEFCDMFAKVVCKGTIVNEDIGTVRKVNPLWIDVFPLVGLPSDGIERTMFFKEYREVFRRIWEDFYATNGNLDVFPKWYTEQRKFLERYDFDESDYVGVIGTVYGDRDSTTRGVYSQTMRAPFEDIEVNIPAGYKEYLDNLYGSDWMRLPEESKRKTHHDMAAYWI